MFKKECKSGGRCFNKDCHFKHPIGWKVCAVNCEDSECQHTHPPQRKEKCQNGRNCYNSKCSFLHPIGWTVCIIQCEDYDCDFSHPPQRKAKCKSGMKCSKGECKFLHPNSITICKFESNCEDFYCTAKHLSSRKPACKSGANCYKLECTFLHPKTRKICNESCLNYECEGVHPSSRKRTCRSGGNCKKINCEFLHPDSRFECTEDCLYLECTGAHPETRKKACLGKSSCYKINCEFLHPRDRITPCELQENCNEFACEKGHPRSRVSQCALAGQCSNETCPFLHPNCENGIHCILFECNNRHPEGRTETCHLKGDCSNSSCDFLHPTYWNSGEKKLKTQAERESYRIQQSLPILTCREKFLQRLEKEKVLVVIAETGSGKTTQLPQYAAEHFSGKVVCTQPRSLAAMTIAERIAKEFDGYGPGENVGYKMGGGKSIGGKKIELFTDFAFVTKAQKDPMLKEVSVLIIDEAHERSLNTDLVIGIAKLLLKQRPNDFYVVIASATINPKPFLEYFFEEKNNLPNPLQVEGKTYPVELEYAPIIEDEEAPNFSGLLIPSVFKILHQYSEGNCLVFLPGSREVENAIREFNKGKESNWIALPLYGTLPPEEQSRVISFDDEDGTVRMIVFCTNIAETSLTVPNIQVVIDTGLAKEARYDPKRRITVIEQVFISKSSANQRKGRAGRTAPGNCIRLYSEDKLVRENIEPEILRSSLELVVLQLKNLHYDPLQFPFISAPNPEFLMNSIHLLQEFRCLDSEKNITARGKLFTEFPFDPRMSHFIMMAHENFGYGESAVQIASILSAPGSLFFLGNAKNRKEIKTKIAIFASHYKSDLLFLLDMYSNWSKIGQVEKNQCKDCKKKIVSPLGCKVCRSKFSSENGLNNKIAEMVYSIEQRVKKKLFSSSKVSTDCSVPLPEAIGKCLISSFRQQICENLISNNPDAGVYLLESASKGVFSSTSSLAQRSKSDSEYFIALSITQISQDLMIIDQGHPIHVDWIPRDLKKMLDNSSLNIEECYMKPNVGPSFRKYVSDAIKKIGEQYSKFSLVLYDKSQVVLRVYAPKKMASEIRSICEKAVDLKLKNEYEMEGTYDISNGQGVTTVISGMKVMDVQLSENVNQVRIVNPIGVKNDIQLKKWICEKGVKESSIKSCIYYPKKLDGFDSLEREKSFGVAVFHDKESSQLIQSISQEEEEGSFGRTVYWKLSQSFTLEYIKSLLFSRNFSPEIQMTPQKFKIKLFNLPPEGNIEQKLKNLNLNQTGTIFISQEESSQSRKAVLQFSSKQLQDRANNILQNSAMSKQPLIIPTKSNNAKRVFLKIKCEEKPSEFMLKFNSVEEASNFIKNFHFPFTNTLESRVFFRIPDPELYDIHSLANQTAERHKVKYLNATKNNSHPNSVTFAGVDPKLCNSAARAFLSSISPLYIRLGTRKQQVMIAELSDSGLLQNYASKQGVKFELTKDPKTNMWKRLKVMGNQISQGMFMAKIGEYADSFEPRYDTIHLSIENQVLFRKQREGSHFLNQIETELKKKGMIQFIPSESILELYLYPKSNLNLPSIRGKIENFLISKGNSTSLTLSKYCVYCRKKGGNAFSICGHHYCTECLESACENLAESESEINCGRCNTPLSILDLKTNLPPDSFQKLLDKSVNRFLRKSPTHPFSICPTPYCNAIKRKEKYYSLCSLCGIEWCSQCGVTSNDLHKNRTCQEFKLVSIFDVRRIFEDAKTFATQNWTLDSITGIYENPGIYSGCPAVQKFGRAVMKYGLVNSFFAWHGTGTSEGIRGICHDGWDPKRRSGQVHGRGEYFGQSASVSAGYSGKLGNMIVALLLKVNSITLTHGNFCYIVDNPIDWTISFNLPVLVLTYQTGNPPEFEIMKVPQPLNIQQINTGSKLHVSDWKSCFRWYWQQDNSLFEPYSDSINSILESQHALYQCGQGSPHFVTQPIVRYLDDIPQKYSIDFLSNIQTNTSTGYARRIKRIKVDIPHLGIWQVQNENGTWVNYDTLVQDSIERGFQSYINGSNPGIVQFRFPGRPEIYSLNFIDGIQTNLETNTKRPMKRK